MATSCGQIAAQWRKVPSEPPSKLLTEPNFPPPSLSWGRYQHTLLAGDFSCARFTILAITADLHISQLYQIILQWNKEKLTPEWCHVFQSLRDNAAQQTCLEWLPIRLPPGDHWPPQAPQLSTRVTCSGCTKRRGHTTGRRTTSSSTMSTPGTQRRFLFLNVDLHGWFHRQTDSCHQMHRFFPRELRLLALLSFWSCLPRLAGDFSCARRTCSQVRLTLLSVLTERTSHSPGG